MARARNPLPRRRLHRRLRHEGGQSLAGGYQLRPDVEDTRVGAQRFALDPGCVGKVANRPCGAFKRRNVREIGDHRIRDAVDVAHALADLDVAAFVKVLDRNRERTERLAP